MLASSDTTPAANTFDEAEASGRAVIGVDGEGGEDVLSGKEGGSALEISPSAGGEGKSVWEGGENWRKVKVRRWIEMGTLFAGTSDTYHGLPCKIWRLARRYPSKMLKNTHFAQLAAYENAHGDVGRGECAMGVGGEVEHFRAPWGP